MSYEARSDALDTHILGIVADWAHTQHTLDEDAFDALALELFAYQLHYNDPYARYCATIGVDERSVRRWFDIPPVPAGAFKEAALATFDAARAALAFETSGTTAARTGRHYFETSALYDAALLAAFDRFMLPDSARLRYLNLVPDPAQRPRSSLGYMMGEVSRQRGDGRTGWYLDGDAFALEAFVADVRTAIGQSAPVCIATTAFALARVLDGIEALELRLPLPAGSRVMETGGFKGRTRAVRREELYTRACGAFDIPARAIVAEYGMTELTTQYYDATLVRHENGDLNARRKLAPPWLRTRVVGPDGQTLPNGTVGALVHVDLANRSSCIAIATEDLGVAFDDGLVLIGRERGAELRGCSLDAESLLRL